MIDDTIALFESAEVGSRELDDEFLLAMGWRVRKPQNCRWLAQDGDCIGCGNKPPSAGCAVPRSGWDWTGPGYYGGPRPSPTRNLQHAVDAVPEGWFFSADIADPDDDYTVNGWNGKMAPDGIDVDGHGRTAQLAVCLAILRAYKAMGGMG